MRCCSSNCQTISFLFFILSQNLSPRMSTSYQTVGGFDMRELWRVLTKEILMMCGYACVCTTDPRHTHCTDIILLGTGSLSHQGLLGPCFPLGVVGRRRCCLKVSACRNPLCGPRCSPVLQACCGKGPTPAVVPCIPLSTLAEASSSQTPRNCVEKVLQGGLQA